MAVHVTFVGWRRDPHCTAKETYAPPPPPVPPLPCSPFWSPRIGMLNFNVLDCSGLTSLSTVCIMSSRTQKASNVMLKSGGSDGRGFTAKVVDFGLAVTLDAQTDQTH
eukprot:26570-Chlamydomonas_euryale.AAC.1